jgi:hypothetical protein
MLIKTGIIPRGFIKVKNEVKNNTPVVNNSFIFGYKIRSFYSFIKQAKNIKNPIENAENSNLHYLGLILLLHDIKHIRIFQRSFFICCMFCNLAMPNLQIIIINIQKERL